MKTIVNTMLLAAGILSLCACARQSTPSMINTTLPRVTEGTVIKEMPVAKVSNGYLHKVASDYDRYGESEVHLSLAYDPYARNYGETNAIRDLSSIKNRLKKMGVRGITAETIKVDGSEPTLMVSYDSATALPPEGCRNMPGLDNSLTTAEIGNYKFGCSVDTMLARQIYRPSDLKGKDDADDIDGRRATNSAEYYRRVDQAEADADLNRIQRTDIAGE